MIFVVLFLLGLIIFLMNVVPVFAAIFIIFGIIGLFQKNDTQKDN